MAETDDMTLDSSTKQSIDTANDDDQPVVPTVRLPIKIILTIFILALVAVTIYLVVVWHQKNVGIIGTVDYIMALNWIFVFILLGMLWASLKGGIIFGSICSFVLTLVTIIFSNKPTAVQSSGVIIGAHVLNGVVFLASMLTAIFGLRSN